MNYRLESRIGKLEHLSCPADPESIDCQLRRIENSDGTAEPCNYLYGDGVFYARSAGESEDAFVNRTVATCKARAAANGTARTVTMLQFSDTDMRL